MDINMNIDIDMDIDIGIDINMGINRKEDMDYLITTKSINKIVNKKFKLNKSLTDKTENQTNEYNNILLYLFLQKLYNYEPGIVRLIGLFHDYNYQYLSIFPYLYEKPVKLTRCMGDYYINNGDIDSCICSSCDPDGFNLLKPYRICHRL